MSRFVPALAASLATAAALTAQVPYGSAIVGVIGNVAPGEGLYLADRLGNCTPVTGLVAAGSANANGNTTVLDPIDDRVWIGSSSNGQVNWVRIVGTTVTQFVQHGSMPGTSTAAFAFDDNSNVIACGGTAAAGGLYLIDRKNGGAGTLVGAVPGTGIHNAMTKDLVGNLYVGMFNQGGEVHVFAKNPDGTYQAPVLLGTVPTTSISGLTFAPADGTNPDELWVTTFGSAGSQMFRITLPLGGVGTAVANSLAGCNWIDYDRSQNDLLVATQAGTDRVVQVDRTTGLDTLLSSIQGGNAGVPAYLDVNDAPFGVTNVAPMILNGAVGPFDLEIGTSAPPGTLAVVGVGAPFVSILGVAIVGADGHLSISIPNITLAGPIAPGTLTFLAAYFDLGGNLQIGSPLPWPAL